VLFAVTSRCANRKQDTSSQDLEIYDVTLGRERKLIAEGRTEGKKAGTWKLGIGQALSKQFQVAWCAGVL